jgi:lysozyme
VITPETYSRARQIGAEKIAGFEGFSPRAYPDPPGQEILHSIGYGHQIVPGDGLSKDSVLEESAAMDLLLKDLEEKASVVDVAVQVDLNENQLAALYSFTYNVGTGAFRSSTMLKLINEGNLEGASYQFDNWVYVDHTVSTALKGRRDSEEALFNSPITDNPENFNA